MANKKGWLIIKSTTKPKPKTLFDLAKEKENDGDKQDDKQG